MEKSTSVKRITKDILMLIIAAVISVVSVHVFVIPSDFSPSGIDGVSTILYEITGINIGWFKFAINLPFMVLAWIYLKKKYVIYVSLFILLDAFGMVFLDEINFYQFVPQNLTAAEAVGYRLLSAIFAGVALGVCVAMTLKVGASSGGVDIISCLVHLKKPNWHIETVSSIICYGVIAVSYFVYWDLTSILLSVIEIFVYATTVSALMKKDRYALEVKIVTKEPEKIRDEILYKHHHSATILKGQGMYSGDDYHMVVTVLNEKDIAAFMTTMKKYPETFIYFSDGVRVQGDFHFGTNVGGRIDAY